ncbi:AraC family transcriptional regulator [Pseudoalteromonas tetraodonis]|uniref:AraC family transcriptional regulator n=1 Tax=Pseudoalteromonas tetraodonis TaxID=43659 RepID=UPI003A984409
MNSTTLIPNTPTTIGSWALLIAKALESYNVDSHHIFSEAKIDLAAIQVNPEVRLPVKQMAILWQLAVKQTNDECFALRLTKYFQPNTYSAVGLAFASSRTIMEGFEHSLRYFKMTTDAAVHWLEKIDNKVILHIDIPPENEPVAVEAIEAFMSTMISLSRVMTTEEFSPLEVSFKHDKSAYVKEYEEFFNCPVLFNQSGHQIIYSLNDLERPQMLANPSLANTLENWIDEHLNRFSQDLVSTKVKAFILDNMLKDDVEIEKIASFLNLGLRTLQRKLKAEGQSFNELLDECRHHMATKLLSEQRVPLIEISYMLGFSDQSGFTRAFRRWTHTSPKHYRDQHGQKLLKE